MEYISTRLCRCIFSAIFFCCVFSVCSQPVLNYTTKVSGLDFPVDIVNAGDGSNRLFIVQQGGLIKLYKNGVISNFANLTGLIPFSVTNEERGMLSMAFHPDYDGVTNRYFFVYYTTTSGNTTVRVARYTTMLGDPDIVSADPPDEVIAIVKPGGQTNHNGGKLNFGSDGMLYFGTGDGGGGNDPNNNAQNGASLLGKMLRIDINGTDLGFYSIPADNPFVAPADGIRDEIWAFGLRNPFRWSFDATTNAMWIADVGQGQREEVNVRMPGPTTGGVNYGWRCYEGTLQPPPSITACSPLPTNYVAPLFEYTHNSTTGGFAITGGYVYRGSNPVLYGYYVFADYVSNNVWVMDLAGNATQQTVDRNGIAGFGLSEIGDLYAVGRGGSLGAGFIDSVGTNAALPSTLISFTGKNMPGYNELRWTTSSEQNADKFIIEYSTDGNNFIPAGEVLATNSPSGSNYSYQHTVSSASRSFYRLRMSDQDGSSRYSAVIMIGGNNKGDIKLNATIIRNNQLEITANTAVEYLRVHDVGGKQVYSSGLNGRQGYFTILLPSNLAKGMYFVTIEGKDFRKTEKILVQ